ncbi:prepilin-type N-terminal cleavage/methylation domain-containing protein [Francisella sp. 19X1-34]|uniref:PilW family protein n=1 Tax=Francisella sp. 19X1-34 TaxID=3087177 RepID=UPI002E31493F|nr:prepilin-type N-terminal cleavage/methylation domain-containing protein [Francisella sp. 19X1-34]MED7789238.1 prepilin-type N-terminal cleavage/methylation domain-containing protein [Francisella sp. 19X1-34]
MMKRRDYGVSLVEVLVTMTVGLIVMVMIVQSFFQMRKQNVKSVQNLHSYTEVVEADNIFRNLIDGAYISGNATYSPWKLSSSQVSGSEIDPLSYPIIYAQGVPLVTNIPADAQAGTDLLVVQTIDDPQILTTTIASGSSSLTRSADGASAVTAGRYMLLSSESHQNLISADSDVASGSTTINLSTNINQSFPVGATLYTDYVVKIIYIREEADNQGNVENDLVELSYDGTGSSTPNVLLSGVSDLQISYIGTNGQWVRVSTTPPQMPEWYKQIRGLRFTYNLNDESHEVIVAFRGLGDNSIP